MPKNGIIFSRLASLKVNTISFGSGRKSFFICFTFPWGKQNIYSGLNTHAQWILQGPRVIVLFSFKDWASEEGRKRGQFWSESYIQVHLLLGAFKLCFRGECFVQAHLNDTYWGRVNGRIVHITIHDVVARPRIWNGDLVANSLIWPLEIAHLQRSQRKKHKVTREKIGRKTEERWK